MRGWITAAIAFACGATMACSPLKPLRLVQYQDHPPYSRRERKAPRIFPCLLFFGVVPIQ